jgi:hypothetical protein
MDVHGSPDPTFGQAILTQSEASAAAFIEEARRMRRQIAFSDRISAIWPEL